MNRLRLTLCQPLPSPPCWLALVPSLCHINILLSKSYVCEQVLPKPFCFCFNTAPQIPSLRILFPKNEGGTHLNQVFRVLLQLGSEAHAPVSSGGALLPHNHLQTPKLFYKHVRGRHTFVADSGSHLIHSPVPGGLSPAHQEISERKCLFQLTECIVFY